MCKSWLKSFVMHGHKAPALLPTQLKLPVQRQMIAVMAPSCK
jgi:hypothetical protein